MTQYPKRPCIKAGCRQYAVPGKQRCPEHQAQWEQWQEAKRQRWLEIRNRTEEQKKQAKIASQQKCDAQRPTPDERGYGSRWRKARQEYLKLNPLCVRCGAPATDVDHIIPHRGNQALFWDVNNWQALCHSCHSRKTQKEDAGKRWY